MDFGIGESSFLDFLLSQGSAAGRLSLGPSPAGAMSHLG